MKYLRKIIFAILMFISFNVTAGELPYLKYYNNTDSQIIEMVENTGPEGGHVFIATPLYEGIHQPAWLYNFMYGFILVTNVCVDNLAFQKTFTVHEVDGRGHITKSEPVYWSQNKWGGVPDIMNYRKDEKGFDCFTLISHASSNSNFRFVIEVKMNGKSYWSGYTTLQHKSFKSLN